MSYELNLPWITMDNCQCRSLTQIISKHNWRWWRGERERNDKASKSWTQILCKFWLSLTMKRKKKTKSERRKVFREGELSHYKAIHHWNQYNVPPVAFRQMKINRQHERERRKVVVVLLSFVLGFALTPPPLLRCCKGLPTIHRMERSDDTITQEWMRWKWKVNLIEIFIRCLSLPLDCV